MTLPATVRSDGANNKRSDTETGWKTAVEPDELNHFIWRENQK